MTPEISYTTFVDFAAKTGGARYTHVKHERRNYEEGYEPFKDFYRALREAIITFHQTGDRSRALDELLSKLTDQNKVRNFTSALLGYRNWLGANTLDWEARPPTRHWQGAGLDVRVNPELGLRVNGDRHIVKLYFKAEKLSKGQVDSMLHLMDITYSNTPHAGTPGILDVRRGKLLVTTRVVPGISAVLRSEAAAFVTLWNSFDLSEAA